MITLSILSRRAETYQKLLHANLPAPFRLTHVQKQSLNQQQCAETQCLLADPDLAAGVIEDCLQLQWLQSTWAGVSELSQLTKQDYLLTGVKGIFGKRMREYVMAYLLEDARKIIEFRQLKDTQQWSPVDIDYLYGKTLGIMGLGNIGLTLAKTAKAFDMQVLGYASQLDYLLILLPNTAATDGLIDATFLSWLPAHTLLINAGRGNAIDDQALCEALNTGQIRAAVLDVFRQEPLPRDHPFWHCANLTISQHTAALTNPAEVVKIFSGNAMRFAQGQPLDYLVNFDKGY